MKTFTTVLGIIVGMAYLALCTPIMNQIYATTEHWLSEKSNQPNPTKPQKSKVAFEPQSFKGVPFVVEPKQQIVSPIAVTIAATLSAAVVTDNAPTGASATDVLEYTAVVSNSGSTDATGVTFTDVLDNNTTLVAGSVTATPIAVNDAYTCVGNVGIVVNAASGVLANDVSPTNIARTVTAASGATANGTYSIAADGSFSYTPNAGFTGTNSFTYTLNTGSLTSTATVNITVSGMIWFVNPSVSSSGTGTLASPFKALANVTGTATGNTIFLYTGTYTGSLTLLASQKLIGQGASASLSSITGLTFTNAPAGVPATGGTNPTWNTAALTINSGNDVQGINLNSTSGTTMTGGATNVGTLKVRDVSLNNTGGQALLISSGGVLDVIFKSLSASGAATGLSVSNATGSFQVLGTGSTAGSGGTINNITNRGVEFISCTNITLKNMNFTSANTVDGGTCDAPNGNSGCNGAIYLRSANTVTLNNVSITGTTAQMGINANDVTSLAVQSSTLSNCGNGQYEGCMVANSLKGTCEITNSTLSNSAQRVVNVTNTGSEVLTMNISGSTLSDAPEDGLLFSITGTTASGSATLNVNNSNFLRNQNSGINAQNSGNSTMTFNMNGSTVDPGTNLGLGIGAVSFGNGTGRSTFNFNIGTTAANTIRGRAGVVTNVLMQGKADGQGRIQNNLIQKVFTTIGTNAGSYINAKSQEDATLKIDITGNQCKPVNTSGVIITDLTTFGGTGATTQFGIEVGVASGSTTTVETARTDAYVNNNTVFVNGSFNAIEVPAGGGVSVPSTHITCAQVTNNTTTQQNVSARSFRLRSGNSAASIRLATSGSGGTDDLSRMKYAWDNNSNTPVSATNANTVTISGPGSYSLVALNTCLSPSNPAALRMDNTVLTENNIVKNETIPIESVGKNTDILKDITSTPSVFEPSGGSGGSSESLLSGETVTVNGSGSGFTLAAGKSTTIKFRATINTGIAAGTCAVSTQGTVSGTNFQNVSTNTVSTTIVSAPVITTCPAALNICSNASQSFAAVASGCPTPTLTYKIGSTIITSPHVFPNGTSTVDVTASNGIGTNAVCSFIVNNTFTLPTSTPSTGLSVIQDVSNPIFKNNCEIYATVTPSAPSPIAGSTTVKTWLETGAFILVKRHYEITPSANVNTAMATIILYFTQTDFDGYNAANAVKLPINAADAANNKANLQIVKYAGSAVNGLPAQYGTTPSIITPTSVVWNGNFWVVTFNVTGFSGFFVKTSSVVLPVTLLSFEGKKLNNNINLLTWHVAEEKDLRAYHVEKSIDGKTFEQAGIVKAKGSNSVYEFTDNNPNGGLSGVYYRLKMIDLDEKFEYSNIINLEKDKILRGVKIYPNPTSNIVNIEIEGSLNKSVQVSVKDISGRVVLQQTLSADNSTINMSSMSDGLYILEAQFADGQKQSFKLVKQ